jgi:hypothetical protein
MGPELGGRSDCGASDLDTPAPKTKDGFACGEPPEIGSATFVEPQAEASSRML